MTPTTLAALLGLAAAFVLPAQASAAPQTWTCSAKKDATQHNLSVVVDGDKVVGFDYLAATRSESGLNSCSLASEPGKAAVSHGGVTTFPLEDEDTAVARKAGDTITFDFGNTRMMNYCGQSSNIAETLTIKSGAKRCSAVRNR
ncbi:hypothetical protein [Caulobacter soli]|uniref:hypothetical protein n=1 Tax=Caulobacter soli TaxID=2708539 RepID=UPI0013EBC6BC|nr:hypothetical protein [Caulobacter soli]